VCLTDTISTASVFAARTHQEVDGNGETVGIGAANLAASMFQGFPVSTSGAAVPSAPSGVRFDAPLFFANARTFREQIRRFAGAEERRRWIVIAAEPITDVDTTAARAL
jgi:MFS superfamily sulfate permease-like transporter